MYEESHRQSKAISDELGSGSILVLTDPAIVAYLSLSAKIEELLQQLEAELKAGDPA